jgi:hypothetical protein
MQHHCNTTIESELDNAVAHIRHLIVLVIRTRQPAWLRRPSRLLRWLTAVVAVALPYLPGASWMNFVPLPLPVLAGPIGVTVAYMLASEWLKRRFFEHEQRRAQATRPGPERLARRPRMSIVRRHAAAGEAGRSRAFPASGSANPVHVRYGRRPGARPSEWSPK